MAKKVDLLDRIDELHANSVTPEEFEKEWGISIEEHLRQMMEFVKEQNADGNSASEETRGE